MTITTKILGKGRAQISLSKRVADAKMYRKAVKFQTVSGKSVELETVYEDSLPNGAPEGTVVGFHGSPGSHHDFKYVRDLLDQMNIRFIGINYPGFTHTPGYEGQDHVNAERQNYSNAVLDELGIDGKVIYVGHSRGCENALQTAVDRKAQGLIMANPIGLRIHKGIRPLWVLNGTRILYDMLPRSLGNAMMMKLYKAIGFKVSTGEQAINAMRSMALVSLDGQLPYIEKTNEMGMKKLVIFSGNDHLMEQEIMFELIEKHQDLRHFNYEDKLTNEDHEKIVEEFAGNRRGASLFVQKDNHFQNKSQAMLIAKACHAIFEATNNRNTNKL
uniref:AB hydrolase-1 domain-containing protein n=1 Tax=Caenorhabditis japonica TaxID=281687 RepID=A0A8R1HM77_CAEJA